ncbi:lipoprotein-releasing system transmembrane protein lolC [Glaciecola punicea ACAM 611]|uniref:Lipoprotein-releasing system transmembrane protein lolC n=2 Tax=Glaciecola TaxID=89404 RepID=H5T9C0_9ALTE|nr:lipoprotein-releasing system transmembrane protein lolC [Glaciecola punicea ACAM 611]
MNGLEGQLKKRILGILPHIVVASENPVQLPPNLEIQVLAQVPYAEREVIVQSRSTVAPLFLQGTQTQAAKPFSIVANNIIDGNWDSLLSGSFNVGISRILAASLDVSLGQQLRLISTDTSIYSPLGRIPSQRLVTVSFIFDINSEMDDKVMFIHLDDLARLSRKKTTQIQQQRLFLRDAFEYLPVVEYLTANDFSLRNWRERQGPLFDAVKMEKNMMSLMLLLVIAVAAFNVVSALVMVVSEKKSDIAILQTQGMLPKDIMKIFLFNGIFNGLKGIITGISLGLLGCWGLNDILQLLGSNLAFGENGQGLPIDIQANQLVFIALGSIILCVLASWYPAYKAQSITPANSLRSE